jgi:hypothetical protein
MNDLIPVPPPRRTSHLRLIVIAILTWLAADTLAGLALLAIGAVLIVRSGKSFPDAVKHLPHDPVFTTTTAIVGVMIAVTIVVRLIRRAHRNRP